MPRTADGLAATRPHRIAAAVALSLGTLGGSVRAQEIPTGWSGTFTQGGSAITTSTAHAAFVLAEDESVHPRVGADGLRCVYGARVRIAAAGRYRFGFELEGGAAQLSVTSEAREALGEVSSGGAATAYTSWLDLRPGEVELVLSFQREGTRPARLRTMWEMQLAHGAGFPPEPLPSSSARVLQSFEAGVARSMRELEGRMLLERKGCTSCHAPGAASSTAVGLRIAPALERAGERASVDWLARWIESPAALRPGSDMPSLFDASDEARAEARAIALFLASLAPRAGERGTIDASLAESGRALYHEVGCIACHGALASLAEVRGDEFLSSAVPEARVSAPFGALGGKWGASALADMLVDPRSVYPDGRMPSLALTRSEAERIAAYLVERFDAAEPEPSEGAPTFEPELVERGRRAFVAKGCGACHELAAAGSLALDHGPPLDALDPARGCLDAADTTSPRYDLDAEQRAALAAGLRSAQDAAGDPAPIDAARRRIALLDCASCHLIDGRGGPASELRGYFTSDEEVDLGDEGRLPPQLSGVGFKLETAWLKRVLQQAGRARPYMAARMPQYCSDAVGGLAEVFAAMEGVVPHTDLAPPAASDEAVLAGRELMGRDAFACITCHDFGDYPAAGTPGTNLTGFAQRLRYEWFRSFLFDPARYKPGTRMPSFGSGGRSTIGSIHGGAMDRQIESMWAYFQLGELMPAPPGVEPASTLELTVGARPRIFRCFLESAGSRAIAVGFPVGTHYSFDANAVRVADAWRGDFIDASGAWANRGGETSGGRGPIAWEAPPGPPLVIGPKPEIWPTETGADAGYRFRGYRIDAEGVPEMSYSVRGVRVRERIEPRVEPTALVREFRVRGLPAASRLWLRTGQDDVVVEEFEAIGERPLEGVPDRDGFVWYGLEPRAGELAFRWEVAL